MLIRDGFTFGNQSKLIGDRPPAPHGTEMVSQHAKRHRPTTVFVLGRSLQRYRIGCPIRDHRTAPPIWRLK